MNLPNPRKLSKSHLIVIADMRRVKVNKKKRNCLGY